MTTALQSATAADPRTGGLTPLLAPRSIAVIGASRSPRTMGHQILTNLLRQGFTGAVYPVNPNAHAVGAVRAYPDVASLPERVDLAVVVVPKEQVIDVAEQCGDAGVRGFAVISAGFREVGPAGAEREAHLLAVARRHGMRMIGPNCMGLINASPDVSMNATFSPIMPPHGHAAFVSQSGALGVSVLDYAREYGIGISQFVSVGNKADVSGNDLLEYWEHDDGVKVILMYVENFGNPSRFLQIASRVTRAKPIIVVKAGRTSSGALAAISHTGALAASDVAVNALLTQAGVLRAGTIEELFDIAMAFGVRSMPRSRRTAIVTNAGGPGILAADAMEGVGLELQTFSNATVDAIRPLLPAETSVGNPLDLIASATPAGYRSALATLLRDPLVDCVVPIFIPPLGVESDAVAKAITEASRETPGKTVVAVLMGRSGLTEWRAEMLANGIPTYIFPESAARGIAALNRHREMSQRPTDAIVSLAVDKQRASEIIARTLAGRRSRLDELEALNLLDAYGIPVVSARLASTRDTAAAAACELGFPVAMKVVSPDVFHKSDVGGVSLGINGGRSAAIAYDRIVTDVQRNAPGARITGVLVEHQVDHGLEMIVGFKRDPSFGVLVMVGLGGVFVEALKDVVFRIAPLSTHDVKQMLRGLRGAALLNGIRGRTPIDRQALEEVILRTSQLAIDIPEISELDINPVLAFERRVVAVDCRVSLAQVETSRRV